MIEPCNGLGDGGHRRAVGHRWPLEHEYRNPQRPRRGDFAVCSLASAVFRHYSVDGERLEYRPILRLRKRPTGENVVRMRHIQRWLDGIHAADNVVVLGSRPEWCQLLAPHRKEDSLGVLAKRTHGTLRVSNIDPKVPIHRDPGRPAQSEQRCAGLRSRADGVQGHRVSVRMRRIDEVTDVVVAKILRESLCSSKAASTHRYRLRGGRCCPTSKRDRHDEIAAFEGKPKLASFRRPSQNQYTWCHG